MAFFMAFGKVDAETSKTPVPKDGCRGEMLKFDARFLYVLRVVIIDFGPDDVFLEQNDRRSTGGDGWSER